MDVCLLDLAEIQNEPLPDQPAASLLADCWVILWSAVEETERAAHALCAALPLITTDEARLN